MVESEAQRSPCAQRFLRSNTNSACATPNGYLSSSDRSNDGDQKPSTTLNGHSKCAVDGIQKPLVNGIHKNGEKNGVSEKKLTNGESNGPKKRVSILKNSITPPVSSSSTPQRVRRSQSLSSTRASAFSEFEKSCLKAHNDFRVKHAVPPLKLSKRLCRFSEEWAKVRMTYELELKWEPKFQLNFRFWRPEAPRCIATIHRMAKTSFVHGVRFQIW